MPGTATFNSKFLQVLRRFRENDSIHRGGARRFASGCCGTRAVVRHTFGTAAVRQVSASSSPKQATATIVTVEVKIWRPRSGFSIEIFESGRLVVSGRENVEGTLSAETAQRLVELGIAALGDFNSQGCEPWRKGSMNAALYALIGGGWRGSVCRNSLDWPKEAGAETHRLLNEIGRYLPDGAKLPEF